MTVSVALSGSSSDPHIRRTISALSSSVVKSKKIVVVTGAGISCSCGIPDFRSSDGLYNLVKKQYPDIVIKGRDLFDSSLFRDSTSTSVFYTFISNLKQSIDTVSPSPTHWFIKTLNNKGKLLRSYTQNIDGLEERVGLLGSSSAESRCRGKGKGKLRMKEVKNVQLHGDIRRVRCTLCSAEFPFSHEHSISFDKGLAPNCSECSSRCEARVARSARALKIGTLRPAIVLYDEPHPLGDDIGAIETYDLGRRPDLLIIMGTSLKVHGLKKLVKEFAKCVHEPTTGSKLDVRRGKVIFVNKTPPSGEWADIIDYHVEGDTDTWVERVLEDWRKMRPDDWNIQTTLVANSEDTGGAFQVVKDTRPKAKVSKAPKKKKAAESDAENVPPLPPIIKDSKPSILIPSPSSPSKRSQDSCHYTSPESSPSKKRTGLKEGLSLGNVMAVEECGLLFTSSQNAKPKRGRAQIPRTKKTSSGSSDIPIAEFDDLFIASSQSSDV